MLIQSPEDLAHAVRDKLPSKRELSPLPWQRQEPKSTLWWLTPSGRNPAYGDGKLVFSLDKDSPRKPFVGVNDALIEVGTIFVGLNVEKGFGPDAYAAGPPKPKYDELLDKLWVWHQVVEGDGPEQFGRSLARLSGSAKKTHLYVFASTARDSDDTRQNRTFDGILFSCHATGIERLLDNDFPDAVLNRDGIDKATTFEALADGLRKVDDYHWVDIYAGTYVAKGDVDLGELDQKVLSYLDPWVRSGYPPRAAAKVVRV
jgi:hypothetical protein